MLPYNTTTMFTQILKVHDLSKISLEMSKMNSQSIADRNNRLQLQAALICKYQHKLQALATLQQPTPTISSFNNENTNINSKHKHWQHCSNHL